MTSRMISEVRPLMRLCKRLVGKNKFYLSSKHDVRGPVVCMCVRARAGSSACLSHEGVMESQTSLWLTSKDRGYYPNLEVRLNSGQNFRVSLRMAGRTQTMCRQQTATNILCSFASALLIVIPPCDWLPVTSCRQLLADLRRCLMTTVHTVTNSSDSTGNPKTTTMLSKVSKNTAWARYKLLRTHLRKKSLIKA